MNPEILLVKQIRRLIIFFIAGLVLSGATAIPLQGELNLLVRIVEKTFDPHLQSGLSVWLVKVYEGLTETNGRYPFIAYGTDWLAFAHFVIAIVFIGPLRDPVRNAWVIEFGMIACVLVIPFALFMGAMREIPFGWRLIDCSFGVVGFIPLWLCKRKIGELVQMQKAEAHLQTR